jgi:hypothetical protein
MSRLWLTIANGGGPVPSASADREGGRTNGAKLRPRNMLLEQEDEIRRRAMACRVLGLFQLAYRKLLAIRQSARPRRPAPQHRRRRHPYERVPACIAICT